jgi:hypothetical protein
VTALALRTAEHHDVRWVTAAPLWTSLLAAADPTADDLDRMQRPALLRMASDDFMEDLAALLADDPAAVAGLEATPVSYRAAPPGAPPAYAPAIDHVKLFQPIHGHFNLVAATLVCRVAGLPDRTVDLAAQEEAGFVVRRVAGDGELAWTEDGWTAVPDAGALVDGERVAPLFGVPYPATADRSRRLFVGLVPTASADSAPSSATVSFSPQPGDRADPPPDRRLEELDAKVITPLRTIAGVADDLRVDPSRFVLLDLGDVLLRFAPALWSAVQARRRPAPAELAAAYDLLVDNWADSARNLTWLDAVNAVWAQRDAIWGETAAPPTVVVDLANSSIADPGLLRARLAAALPARTPEQAAEPQPPFDAPKLDPRPGTRYVIRCVYRRPRCGALHPDLVSDPSRPFAIASFFDLDAPARPLHITMPLDTTIAGLRKSPKNVHVMLSRELRAQMSRVTDLKKAMEGDLDDPDSLNLGMICSFSLPIITICALILLIVIVAVLNIVFFWLPFFRICFPVPVKGKG